MPNTSLIRGDAPDIGIILAAVVPHEVHGMYALTQVVLPSSDGPCILQVFNSLN